MIDPNKTYRTRDGREVRIYAVDGAGETVHGAILYDGRDWRQHCWTRSGRYDAVRGDHHNDLIEVRPRIRREVWVNVYCHDDGGEFVCIYDNKSEADDDHGSARRACVKLTIDCEEGEGL